MTKSGIKLQFTYSAPNLIFLYRFSARKGKRVQWQIVHLIDIYCDSDFNILLKLSKSIVIFLKNMRAYI